MSSSITKEEVKELFDEYYIGLVEFSYRMVHNEDESRDIVQDIFVKLLEKKLSFPTDRKLIKSYLYSMVKNATLNHLRKKKTALRYTQLNNDKDYSESTVLDALIHAELINNLHAAIQSLPKACKKICELTYIEGKSNKEAAELSGTSINTVKTHKRRALVLLKKKMRPAMNTLKMFLIFF